MKINKAYKFRLEPNAEQQIILNNLVGSARFVWNQMLAISFEMFAKNEFINATNLVNKIMVLKNNPDEPPRDCRRLNILREYDNEKTNLHS